MEIISDFIDDLASGETWFWMSASESLSMVLNFTCSSEGNCVKSVLDVWSLPASLSMLEMSVYDVEAEDWGREGIERFDSAVRLLGCCWREISLILL